MLQHAADNSNSKGQFVSNSIEAICYSGNAQCFPELAPLLNRLRDAGTARPYRVRNAITHLVKLHRDVLQDPDFGESAIHYFKANSQDSFYDRVQLAHLGDKACFTEVLTTYFDIVASPAQPDLPGNADEPQYERRSVENDLLPSIVFHGEGNRIQGIKENYHDAVFLSGQWVVKDPNSLVPYEPSSRASMTKPYTDTPSSSEPPTSPAQPSQPPAPSPSSTAPVPPNNASTSNSSAPAVAAQPSRVVIKVRAPIETLDGDRVSAVSMAAIGASYSVVRTEGNFLILQDTSGTKYRIAAHATSALPESDGTASSGGAAN